MRKIRLTKELAEALLAAGPGERERIIEEAAGGGGSKKACKGARVDWAAVAREVRNGVSEGRLVEVEEALRAWRTSGNALTWEWWEAAYALAECGCEESDVVPRLESCVTVAGLNERWRRMEEQGLEVRWEGLRCGGG